MHFRAGGKEGCATDRHTADDYTIRYDTKRSDEATTTGCCAADAALVILNRVRERAVLTRLFPAFWPPGNFDLGWLRISFGLVAACLRSSG